MKRQKLGGRLAAAALALMMTSSMTLSVFAEEMQSENASNATEFMDEAYYGDNSIGGKIGQVAWETGLAAFGKFVPCGSLFTPTLKALGELIGITGGGSGSKEPTASGESEISKLSDEIQQSRDQIIDHINTMEKNLSIESKTNTTKILNEISYEGYITNLGSELDSLHTTVNTLAVSINSVQNSDPEKKEDPDVIAAKAVQIAHLIGSDKDWASSDNVVFKVRKIGNILSGNTFTSDKDVYQVFYDYYTNKTLYSGDLNKAMLSGEAYANSAPYIDRIMSEYYYAYTVLVQCFDAALTVSEFTDEQKAALSDDVKLNYIYIPTETVKAHLNDITNQIFNAEDENSVISRYAVFNYKKDHDNTLFIYRNGDANTTIRISPDIDCVVPEEHVSVTCHRFKNPDLPNNYFVTPIDDRLKKSPISDDYMVELLKHVQDLGKGLTFLDYLKKAGIPVDTYQDLDQSFFPISMQSSYKHDQHVKYKVKTFDPRNAGTNQFEIDAVDAVLTGVWNQYDSTIQSTGVKLLFLREGTDPIMPATAAETEKFLEEEAANASKPADNGNAIHTPNADENPTIQPVSVEDTDTTFRGELNPFAPTIYSAAAVQTTASTPASGSTSSGNDTASPTIYSAAAVQTTASTPASSSTSSGNDTARNTSAVVASSPSTGDSRPSGLIAVCTASLLAVLLTVRRKKHD